MRALDCTEGEEATHHDDVPVIHHQQDKESDCRTHTATSIQSNLCTIIGAGLFLSTQCSFIYIIIAVDILLH